MTLESILKNGEVKRNLLFSTLLAGSLSGLGCASTVIVEQNQGGNAGSEQSGAAGFGGFGGSEEICNPNASLICHESDVYWQDSCGELGDLYQTCLATQICENGQCVQDCSMTTPTSGCLEQNCAFYDSFENDLCKWYTFSGTPSVSSEVLDVNGKTLVQASGPITLPSAGDGDFISRYTIQLLDTNSGSVDISYRIESPTSGLTLHHTYENNNKIFLHCNNHTTIVDTDLHTQKKIEVRKKGNNLALQVDDVITTIPCNDNDNPILVNNIQFYLGSSVIEQDFKIDDIMVYCP